MQTLASQTSTGGRQATPSVDPAPLRSAERALLQRKCEKRSGGRGRGLQTKLVLNQPGDRFEQEADRMAEAVVSENSVPTGKANSPLAVQRQAVDEKKKPPP